MKYLAAIVAISAAIAACGPAAAQETPPQRVLILLGEGFNTEEFYQPYYALLGAGYTVEVAGAAAGTVAAGSKDRSLDFDGVIAVSDVKVDDYIGLVIPGGGGPAALEQHSEAIEICRKFAAARKPVAAICHGPRLLARAGVLRGRTITALWKVKDELPQEWASGEFGTYLDQAVVIDGNLLTSRYPWDSAAFCGQTLLHLVRHGARGDASRSGVSRPRVLVIDAKCDKKTGWAFIYAGMAAQGVDVKHVPVHQLAAFAASDEAKQRYAAVILLGGSEAASLKSHNALVPLVDSFKGPVFASQDMLGDDSPLAKSARAVEPLGGDNGADLRRVVKAIAPTEAQPIAAAVFDSAILVGPGFDDAAVTGMNAYLRYKGLSPVIVSDKAGTVRGLGGTVVTATEMDDALIAPDAVIVAAGNTWPDELDSGAAARVEWLLKRYEGGARVAAFGFDALALGKLERFKGKSFATSDQARWAFGKDGGKFSDAPVVVTEDRLLTVKGASALPEAMKALDAWTAAKTPADE